MSEELKPCPFCGSKAMFIGGGTRRFEKRPIHVECVSRLCTARTQDAFTRESAASIWNTRTAQQAPDRKPDQFPDAGELMPLTVDERKRLKHCSLAVSDWLAEGCDTNDIPRPHIAALVAFAVHGIGDTNPLTSTTERT